MQTGSSNKFILCFQRKKKKYPYFIIAQSMSSVFAAKLTGLFQRLCLKIYPESIFQWKLKAQVVFGYSLLTHMKECTSKWSATWYMRQWFISQSRFCKSNREKQSHYKNTLKVLLYSNKVYTYYINSVPHACGEIFMNFQSCSFSWLRQICKQTLSTKKKRKKKC